MYCVLIYMDKNFIFLQNNIYSKLQGYKSYVNLKNNVVGNKKKPKMFQITIRLKQVDRSDRGRK